MQVGIQNIVFIIILIAGIGFFVHNIRKLIRTIQLGKKIKVDGTTLERLKTMARVALGQGKMMNRPIAGFFHIVVYIGFIIINIEVLEIILDGILGTHRIFKEVPGYSFLIASFEILAALVIISVIVFWIRRNILTIQRFRKPEMKGFPKKDANYILYFELVLMFAFLKMNAADYYGNQLTDLSSAFPVSKHLFAFFDGYSTSLLHFIERGTWWFHIVGILIFLNYLYYSKHLHILLAFPNTYFSKLSPKGEFTNLESVTREVKLMLDPNADPFAQPSADAAPPETFGAKDIFDLSQIQLLNAYTCTECGRCTSECPANMTGKKLSPRKIMMDTRDRLEEVSKNIDRNKEFQDDGKTLLNDYITPEEIWACTSCNACTEACPVNIDPLSIIIDIRRYLVMEESAAPQELNLMMTNIENNGAPWQFSQADRLKWADS